MSGDAPVVRPSADADKLIVGTTDHVVGRDSRIIDKSTRPDLKRGRA